MKSYSQPCACLLTIQASKSVFLKQSCNIIQPMRAAHQDRMSLPMRYATTSIRPPARGFSQEKDYEDNIVCTSITDLGLCNSRDTNNTV